MNAMPARPQPPAMTPDELRALMESRGLNNRQLAELLGVHRNTVSRWLRASGDEATPIDAANALLIRTKLRAKK